MNDRQFKRLLESIAKLTAGQLERVRTLTTEHTVRANYRAIETACPCSCRRCGSEKVTRNGVQNGLQRFRCHACGKTFNAAVATARYGQVRGLREVDTEGLHCAAGAVEVGLTLDRARTDVVGIFPNEASSYPLAVPCCSSRTTSGHCSSVT